MIYDTLTFRIAFCGARSLIGDTDRTILAQFISTSSKRYKLFSCSPQRLREGGMWETKDWGTKQGHQNIHSPMLPPKTICLANQPSQLLTFHNFFSITFPFI
ncbi:hypothetical protein CEXT_268541 [Caerostris extrusa]|uniref:Uncharacterized protein n=1 Tax=Caerostris extrusa TaxID=172846 RepID=A0AAV4VDC0_CAEEX|nr:hypothetical protein CEXT_268541 [Caerostris extrusa]